MASRPIFVPGNDDGRLYHSENITFQWHSGMSAAQKQRSMLSLHESAKTNGYCSVLEVSTKSSLELGRRLSAFTLNVDILGYKSQIECIFQGSKLFERGGPFPQIFNFSPIEAKRYFRSVNLGKIIGFQIDKAKFSNYPMHAFYDWLFIRSLSEHEGYLARSFQVFDAFSDIEFNPVRSVNTQARTMAIIATLIRRDQFQMAADDYEIYREILCNSYRAGSIKVDKPRPSI